MKNAAQHNITRSLKTSNSFIVITAAILLLSFPAGAADNILHLSSLDLSKMTSGWGSPVADKSVQSKPLTIAGKTFDKGVGTHAGSVFHIDLHGQTKRFSAEVGIDDETSGKGSVRFRVYADGKKLFDSGTIKGGQAPQHIDLNLKNAKLLTLIVTDAGDNIGHDHANWANAFFEYKGTPPTAIDSPPEPKIILTPKPPLSPRINAPKVYGARPGRPFLYRIPTTGTRPITFTADDMPPTLKLDPKTGIITGTTPEKKADYRLALKAVNKYGQTQRGFTIVVGDTLALTPPMGWNHWYTYYNNITDDLMRIAADAMIASGMADFGYQYVNIDDCWMNAPSHRDPLRVGPLRDDEGNILSNKHFPDMRALADYIHAKGLKAGLYTSPGPLTCAGFSGSYQHEQQDAQRFADWGFDFLKYDWCSYGRIAKDRSLPELQKPYRLMGDILRSLDRDIVFNLCQYGMGDVAEWGAEVGGNCWRTAGDLGFSLTNYHNVAVRNAALYENAKPGAWNDPDYLLLGTVGNAHKIWDDPTPCPLTPNEQYSYMSLWCMMASPLFFTGDMARIDDFTLNLLCNAEVIEVNQDPLGQQGRPVIIRGSQQIWTKQMEDGSLVVGLFNRDEIEQTVTLQWKDIDIKGRRRIRDLWRQKNLGTFKDKFQTNIPRHGVTLIRLYTPN